MDTNNPKTLERFIAKLMLYAKEYTYLSPTHAAICAEINANLVRWANLTKKRE